jgi:hypothetical protein
MRIDAVSFRVGRYAKKRAVGNLGKRTQVTQPVDQQVRPRADMPPFFRRGTSDANSITVASSYTLPNK